jgi:Zn-dependent protease
MPASAPGSFRILTAFGIDVFVHWTWFLVVVFLLRGGAGMYDHIGWNIATILALFGIVTLHEFGHALACRSVGGYANTIVLWPLGGVAFVRPPDRPGPVLWSIAAGPLVNVALIPVTFGLVLLFAGIPALETLGGSDLERFLIALAAINLMLLIFNILPIYPLDGGQILQAILWVFLGRATSLKITAGFGLLVAAVVAIPLLLLREWWLLLIAAFVAWQAYNGLQMARSLARLEEEQREHAPWKM